MKSDDAWKKIGQNDPYWGVVTHDKYRAENIDEKLVNEFFHQEKIISIKFLKILNII